MTRARKLETEDVSFLGEGDEGTGLRYEQPDASARLPWPGRQGAATHMHSAVQRLSGIFDPSFRHYGHVGAATFARFAYPVAAMIYAALILIACLLLAGCGNGVQDGQAASDSFATGGTFTSSVSDTAPAPSAVSATDTSAATSQSELELQIEDVLDQYGDSVEVAFIPLDDTEEVAGGAFSVNGDAQMKSASLIKLLVLAEFLDECDEGTLSIDMMWQVTPNDIVAGTGVMQNMLGESLTLRRIAGYMITDSDNTGANILIDLMGMDPINEEADELGLTGTVLKRKMMDTEAQSYGLENLTCADDMAFLLAMIYNGELVSGEASGIALGFLEEQNLSEGLDTGVPSGVLVAHKTGTLDACVHDVGIVEAEHPYVLAVMTDNAANAKKLIGQVSQVVYQATNG